MDEYWEIGKPYVLYGLTNATVNNNAWAYQFFGLLVEVSEEYGYVIFQAASIKSGNFAQTDVNLDGNVGPVHKFPPRALIRFSLNGILYSGQIAKLPA